MGPSSNQGIVTAGLNVAFKPWGLSFNATASLLRKSLSDEEGDPKVALFSLSYSFGRYAKHPGASGLPSERLSTAPCLV